jgi:hypothetical protein
MRNLLMRLGKLDKYPGEISICIDSLGSMSKPEDVEEGAQLITSENSKYSMKIHYAHFILVSGNFGFM